jgi:putative Holliday junction resolvase
MKRIMGLDLGDATIGIAMSDALRITAQGRENYRRQTTKEDINHLINYIVEDDVETVVVGLPKNMNGTIGPQAEKTQSFIKKLEKRMKYSERLKDKTINVVYWDERLTSVAAEKSMLEADLSRAKRRKIIDKLAAMYILQGYLDSLS